MTPWIGFSGSRRLPPAGLALAASLARSAAAAGRGVAVGCAVGSDQAVLSALLALPGPFPLRAFAVGGPDGAGFWSGSLPLDLLLSADGPVQACGRPSCRSVSWWAGGGPALPLVARLSRRSLALVAFLAARPRSGLVALFGSPSSRGTLLTCRAAAAAGVPVVAFACGFDPLRLPLLSPGGSWVDARRQGVWRDALRWQPEQPALPLP